MKVIAVAILVLATLCNSMLAVASDPIPFSRLARNAGVHLVATPVALASDDTTTTSTPPVHPPALSHGQKVMIGVGIGFLGIGAALFGFGAAINSKDIGAPSRSAVFGAGCGAAGTGVVLIVLGTHHHRAK